MTPEEKFKKGLDNPAQTEITIKNNPDKAEEKAKIAQFNCSDFFGKKSVKKTFKLFFPFFGQ